jgi:hypothetical protein
MATVRKPSRMRAPSMGQRRAMAMQQQQAQQQQGPQMQQQQAPPMKKGGKMYKKGGKMAKAKSGMLVPKGKSVSRNVSNLNKAKKGAKVSKKK